MNRPWVTVIVPARDAAPTLGRTLAALGAQELEQPFEVIVVDDGSRDETAAIARAHEPTVRLVRTVRSLGPGAARNLGVQTGRGEVLAFTDADCFPAPRWLAHGLARFADADLVQGRVEPDPGTARTAFDRTLVVERDGGFYQTANLFVRRELFEAVGGFRDWALEQPGRRRFSPDRRRSRATRTPIGEDTLFAWSARRLGARSAFASDALVHHAVVPGDVRDAIADRWHWARDMPGLARFVPELREGTFYRRWFFAGWTARFDFALAGLLAAALTRRPWWLAAALPYASHVRREVATSCVAGEGAADTIRCGAATALGTAVADGATLAGLLAGSAQWRCLVL